MFIFHKRHITLMELIIVMAILAMTAGFMTINTFKFLREQRFKNETDIVLNQLRLAQNLMLILNTDVHLIFSRDPQTQEFRYRLKMDEQLSKNWNRELSRPHSNFKTITHISFNDNLEYPSKPGEIDIKFLSGGSIMSSGMLRLSTSENVDDKNSLVRYIYLAGYPQSISIMDESDTNLPIQKLTSTDSQMRMTQYTMAEVDEKLQSRDLGDAKDKKKK